MKRIICSLTSLLFISTIAFSLYSFAHHIIYPLTYLEEISSSSKKYDVDPFIMAAIIYNESSFTTFDYIEHDYNGLINLTETAATHWANTIGLSYAPRDMMKPQVSIEILAFILSNAQLQSQSEQLSDFIPIYLNRNNEAKVNPRFMQAIEGHVKVYHFLHPELAN